jgi:hypothetical protein
MMRTPPTPPKQAIDRGHRPEWDPPAALTAAERWTCPYCGDAVLRYGNVIYGSATERDCPARVAEAVAP